MQMAVSRPIQVHAGVFISRQVILSIYLMPVQCIKYVDLKCTLNISKAVRWNVVSVEIAE